MSARLCLLAACVLAWSCGGEPLRVDAGPSDGGFDASSDAGALDATIDAGATEDGATDAGPSDAGSLDAGLTGAAGVTALREHFCDPLGRAVCGAVRDCRCTPTPLLHEWPWDTPACIAAHSTLCNEPVLIAFALETVRSGRSTVDLAALERCERRVTASYEACSARMADVVEWCQRAVIDGAALGESCDGGTRICAGGRGRCDVDPERPLSPAPCVPLPGTGDACTNYCAEDLVCIEGVCAAERAAGEGCETDADCAAALVCSGGVCRSSLLALHAPCTTDDECDADLACIDDRCERAPRDACADDSTCGSLARCEAPGAPVCLAWLPIGAACDPIADACGPGSSCERVSPGSGEGTCVALPSAGEPCLPSTRCGAGTYCEAGAGSTCLPLPLLGQPCAFTGGRPTCAGDSICRGGVCTPPGGEGSPCGEAFACPEGLACGVDDTCVRPLPVGEACSRIVFPSACEPDAWCDPITMRCLPRPGEGALGCAFSDCVPGLECVRDRPEDAWEWICRPPGGAGATCELTCASGASCVFPRLRCEPRVCSELP